MSSPSGLLWEVVVPESGGGRVSWNAPYLITWSSPAFLFHKSGNWSFTISFLCGYLEPSGYLLIFFVLCFMVIISFMHILECQLIRAQKICSWMEQTCKNGHTLFFHRIVVSSVKWDVRERMQIQVPLFLLVFTYTVAVWCLTFPQKFILGAAAKFAFLGECQGSLCRHGFVF